MKLYGSENATKFDSKEACQAWIGARVVRFKLRMVKTLIKDPHRGNSVTFMPKKCDGKILDTTVSDFKPSGTDEPLEYYAEPTKQDGKWVAMMRLQG